MRFVILILLTVTFVCASGEGERKYKHGFGWDSGLLYQRYIDSTSFWGIKLDGDYRKNNDNENTNYNQAIVNSDTSDVDRHSYRREETSRDNDILSIKVALRYGLRLYKYKRLEFYGVVQPYFQYSKTNRGLGSNDNLEESNWNETVESGLQDDFDERVTKLGGVQLNIEPSFWVSEQIQIGTRLGVRYYYQFNDFNGKMVSSLNSARSSEDDNSNRDTSTSRGNDGYRETYRLDTVGPVSFSDIVDMKVFGIFYF